MRTFRNVAIVSNIDGLISILCDHEKRGSEYYHEYFFLNNNLEVKAHFTSKDCLNAVQLNKENESLFEIYESLFDGKEKNLIVKVNPDFSYEVLHEIEEIEQGIEDGAFAIKKNGLWGFIDENGNEFIKPQYEDYVSFSFGLAGVCKDGKWGFINKKNVLIIPCEYDFPEHERRQWEEYNGKFYISVMKNDKWGIIDSDNNVIIPFKYDYIECLGNLIPVVLDDKLGFIDINDNIIIPFIYEHIEFGISNSYSDIPQYRLIGQNGLKGLFDITNGKTVIPCEYKEIEVNENAIIAQKQNDKYVLIDFDNKELSAEFEYILEQSEGMFSVFNGTTTAFMNNKGEIVTPFIYKKHPCFFNGGLCVAAYKNFNKGFDVINKKGEVLYHSDKYRDVFNAGNGCILAENQNGEFEFKRLL